MIHEEPTSMSKASIWSRARAPGDRRAPHLSSAIRATIGILLMSPTDHDRRSSVPAPSDPPRTRLRAAARSAGTFAGLLLAGAARVIFARAGAGPLANFDDTYYAEKTRQMLRTGDWLTPRFGGVKRLDNPPLFLWLMAASFATLAVTRFAAMLWSALAGVACVVPTHRLALRPGRDPFEAWAAGVGRKRRGLGRAGSVHQALRAHQERVRRVPAGGGGTAHAVVRARAARATDRCMAGAARYGAGGAALVLLPTGHAL